LKHHPWETLRVRDLPSPSECHFSQKIEVNSYIIVVVNAGDLRTDLKVQLMTDGAVILGFVNILLLKAEGAATLVESRAFSRAGPQQSNASVC